MILNSEPLLPSLGAASPPQAVSQVPRRAQVQRRPQFLAD